MSEENSLLNIFETHKGKCSDKWSSYLEIYWQLFSPIRDSDSDILEIGIQNGGSLEIWAEFFPNAKNILGLDVHPKCKDLKFSDSRIKVRVGDATEKIVGTLLSETSPILGVVIDDGSHISRDIIRSFLIFFSQLKPGGIYVIEDLHSSYWSGWQGGISHPESSMQFLKLLADVINFDHWGIRSCRTDLFDLLPATSGLLEESILSEVESVSFFDSVCVVRKKTPLHQGLGLRLISGSEASVSEIPNDKKGIEYIRPDQGSNPFSIAREISPIQTQSYKTQNQELQTQNQELQTQNQELQTQKSHLEDSINTIRATFSWRITKPLRDIKAKLSRKQKQTHIL